MRVMGLWNLVFWGFRVLGSSGSGFEKEKRILVFLESSRFLLTLCFVFNGSVFTRVQFRVVNKRGPVCFLRICSACWLGIGFRAGLFCSRCGSTFGVAWLWDG